MKKLCTLALVVTFTALSGCVPSDDADGIDGGTSASAVNTTPAVVNAEQDLPEAAHTVSLHVPKMECPFACWPEVQKTLEAQPGVAYVKLADQKEKDAIDDRTVHIGYNGDFDKASAMIALAKAGFEDSAIKE